MHVQIGNEQGLFRFRKILTYSHDAGNLKTVNSDKRVFHLVFIFMGVHQHLEVRGLWVLYIMDSL